MDTNGLGPKQGAAVCYRRRYAFGGNKPPFLVSVAIRVNSRSLLVGPRNRESAPQRCHPEATHQFDDN